MVPEAAVMSSYSIKFHFENVNKMQTFVYLVYINQNRTGFRETGRHIWTNVFYCCNKFHLLEQFMFLNNIL
jgi:hypothetical protein